MTRKPYTKPQLVESKSFDKYAVTMLRETMRVYCQEIATTENGPDIYHAPFTMVFKASLNGASGLAVSYWSKQVYLAGMAGDEWP